MPKTPKRTHPPMPGCSMRTCGQSPQPWRLRPGVPVDADRHMHGDWIVDNDKCPHQDCTISGPTAGKGCPGCPHPTPDMTCWRYPYPPCGSYDQAQAKPTPRAALGLTKAQRQAIDAAAESHDYAELHHVVERLLADAAGPCGYDMGEGDTCLLPRNHGGQHS